MTCLPLENLNGWLFSIQAARVKPEFRERLRTYQKECFQVLDAYWRTGAAIRPEVRAAAPEATRALFEEIEGMTGLNPEAAQPGTEAYTWVSTSEAARRLGVGRTLVQYRIAAASIPTRQVGPFRLVPLEALQANLERDPVNTGVGCKAVKPGSFPTGELLRELRELLGDEGTRSALHRMWPAFFPEGGAQ
jgi:GNAT superfamily N-acetyltransferase